MSDARLRTALVGFGRIAAGLADDPVMARHFPEATHAQVLAAHPEFRWDAVVDPSPAARAAARERWKVPCVAADLGALPRREEIEVVVIATPPETRGAVLGALPGLRAVLVEKPLGIELSEAQTFVAACRARGVLVQVDLLARADPDLRALAAGGLKERIGAVQAAFGVYGNGLSNNGTHLVDWIRLLLGEVAGAQAAPAARSFAGGPIPGDLNLPFVLWLAGGGAAMVQPLRFDAYREVGLDLWGDRGRLALWNEGLTAVECKAAPHRFLDGAREIASDRPTSWTTGLGRALHAMYDNLAAALRGAAPLVSPGEDALRTMSVVEAIRESARNGGAVVAPRALDP
jgi:predicted dehydrogenase